MFLFKTHVPFLIVGHPRCGTTSAAEICQQMGRDVGDEFVGKDGISSWMMAVEDKFNPFSANSLGRSRRNLRWDHLIVVTRDINDAVSSVILENKYSPTSYAFRQRWIKRITGLDLSDSCDEMAAAIQSIVAWYKIILDQKPVLKFRIEDQQHLLREFVAPASHQPGHSAESLDVRVNAAKLYGGVRHEKPEIGPADWEALAPDVKRKVIWYGEMFGYKSPFSLES